MIEKDTGYSSYQKKITPYLDGSLSKDETSEFEAFVMTHPEFEIEIKQRQAEIQLLKNLIPATRLTKSSNDTLKSEMRSSIFHLLKEEPSGIFDSVRIKWEEWVNR